MASLETTLQQAAANGLRGLTLYPVEGGRWQASRTLDGTGWRVGTADDPITAVLSVIGDSLPLAGVPTSAPTAAPAPIDEDIFG